MCPQCSYPPGGKPAFDPAHWLAWAGRCGYRVYLCVEPGEGRFRLVMERPSGPKATDDLELWRAFQGRQSERQRNRAALVAHLARNGHFDQ